MPQSALSRASATAATLFAPLNPLNIDEGPRGASPPPQEWTTSKTLKVNSTARLAILQINM